jgi:hypothetical protein
MLLWLCAVQVTLPSRYFQRTNCVQGPTVEGQDTAPNSLPPGVSPQRRSAPCRDVDGKRLYAGGGGEQAVGVAPHMQHSGTCKQVASCMFPGLTGSRRLC